MPFIYLEPAESPQNKVELSVAVEGMKITVGAGDFKIAGKSYSLPEAVEFEAEADAEEKNQVTGFLVEDAEGNAAVLVDEVLWGEDTFDWGSSPYRLLLQLFHLVVPPEAESLGTVVVYVTRTVKEDPLERPPYPGQRQEQKKEG